MRYNQEIDEILFHSRLAEVMEHIEAGSTRLITGNNITTCIAVNRGTLRVVGNQCHVSVLCNLGVVMYTGNHGFIHIGAGASTNKNNVKGQIFLTGLNLKLFIDGDTCQQVHVVGAAELHLPHSITTLNGCSTLKVKKGQVKKPINKKTSNNKPKMQNPTTSLPCNLVVNGMNGVDIGFLTRKNFGL